MTIKLLVCCHKEGESGDGLVTTVAGGAALEKGKLLCDYRDDDGENISSLNPVYNELTVLYWAWKNYAKLGSPDYLGLMHYRRYFRFEEGEDALLRTSCSKGLFREKSLATEERVRSLLSRGDFLCPRPMRRRSVYRQYAFTQTREDLDLAITVLKELRSEYQNAAERYLNGKDCYFFNMFVFPKEIFFRYCEYLFPILAEYVARRKGEGRLYISECLTGVFLTELMREGLVPIHLPVLYRENGEDGRFARFRRGWKEGKTIKTKFLAVARLFAWRRRERRRI